MLIWLRSFADRIMGRNGKPSRLDAATRRAMDADMTTSRPPPPLQTAAELSRLVDKDVSQRHKDGR
jgi:hypothetical protein